MSSPLRRTRPADISSEDEETTLLEISQLSVVSHAVRLYIIEVEQSQYKDIEPLSEIETKPVEWPVVRCVPQALFTNALLSYQTQLGGSNNDVLERTIST